MSDNLQMGGFCEIHIIKYVFNKICIFLSF